MPIFRKEKIWSDKLHFGFACRATGGGIMREAAKRILSWIVILTVTGTFLSKSVFDVLAVEHIQAEASVTESTQTDFTEEEIETGGDKSVPEDGMGNTGGGASEKEGFLEESPEEETPGKEGSEGETPGKESPEGETPGKEGPEEETSDEESSEEEKPDPDDSDVEETDAEDTDTEAVFEEQPYILYIIHTLQYTKDGEEKSVQKLSQLLFKQDDFEDGAYSLMEQAYDWEAVTASPGTGCAEYISTEDFEENEEGERECWAEIHYEVKAGWRVKFRQGGSSEGIALFSIYEGSFDDIEFEKAETVTLTISYKYSNTGGLAGIDAHAPDVIVLPLQEDGTADLKNWRVPHYEVGNPNYHGHSHANLEGFRTVLDPEPLNEFLVNPEAAKNPAAYPDALEKGEFNLRADVDIHSPEYQAAWDEARTTTVEGVDFTYIAPTANGGTGATTSSDPDKMYTLNASGLTEDLSLTIYYRRAMGSYKVNYWKAGANADGTDEKIKEVEMSGRIGALTNAKHLTESSDLIQVQGYLPEDIAQKTIAPDGSTEVNVYYSAGRIRVIFNTNYIYIPRQQVPVNGNVDFGGIDEAAMNAARAGYRFDGWQYEDKDGNRCDLAPDMAGKKLRLSSEFLAKADIKSSAETGETSIQVLNLYPKWVEDSTTVRIVFWAEDLNGQDVKVEDIYHDFDGGTDRKVEREGYRKITHGDYEKSGEAYTNVASFTVSAGTGTDLIGEVIDTIEAQIGSNLSRMGEVSVNGNGGTREVSLSDFYERQGVRILNGGENGRSAAADGSTQIYVYFARKEYALDFVYYFLPEHTGKTHPQICTNTDGFSRSPEPEYSNWKTYPSTVGIENIELTDAPVTGGNDNKELFQTKIPQRTVITAKYGADLRNVWPGAEAADAPDSTRYLVNNKSNLRISWATTIGIHNEIEPGGNINVPGAYSTMSEAIVADTGDNSKVHHLVAFWKGVENNTYRYNYCYEVPDLGTTEVKGCPKIDILNGTPDASYDGLSDEEKERRNTLYLVPADWEAFSKYGFSDLLTYDELALKDKERKTPEDLEDDEIYYVIRIYDGKCYAVSRQLVALSALAINAQNPSARPNLTLVNTSQDYSTELPGNVGSGNGGYKRPDNPYDIYFYYAREKFTITYMSDATTEIGKITLPYGAKLYGERYNIPLEYRKKAGDYTAEDQGYAGWSTEVKNAGGTAVNSADFPVCPGRAENGTRVWKFAGWYLSPFGSRSMKWEENSRTPVVIGGNLRLYANWEKPAYRVEFDWNGGSILPEEDQDEEELKNQSISANRSLVEDGQIPRPVREGYILQGWEITHRGEVDNGGIRWIEMTRTDGALPEFFFDEPISKDLKVRAVWTPSGVAEISYTVFYLEESTGDPVADPKEVTGSYRAGMVVWERPAVPKEGPYRNYVPLEQNKSITLDTVKENRLVFEYVEPSEYPYQVKFKERGTDIEILSYEYKTKSASLVVCPEKEQVNKLDGLGYWVVDDTGKPEERGAKLGRAIRPGEGKNPEAVFYVLPKEYEISYTNLEVMGEEAEAELRTKNPKSYTMKDAAVTLKNPPEDEYLYKGKVYHFKGWRMEKTEEIGTVSGETPDFGGSEIAESVTIQPGSKGRLVFQAVWTPETYVVYFYPGDGGTFPHQEPVINFGGLESGTPLTGNVTVPAVTPKENDAFIGWRWEEGADTNRLYTEKEIYAMSVGRQDMHFVARYQSEKTNEPPKGEPERKGNPGNGGGPQNSGTPQNSGGPADQNDFWDLTEWDNHDTSENEKNRGLPQTGMLWWPVWLLGCAGVIMLAGGIVGKKSSGKRHEE